MFYSIHFLKRYKLEPNVGIAVCGNLPELGAWKKFIVMQRCPCCNNPQHLVSVILLPNLSTLIGTGQVRFKYKYQLVNTAKMKYIAWEFGHNRTVLVEQIEQFNFAFDLPQSSIWRSVLGWTKTLTFWSVSTPDLELFFRYIYAFLNNISIVLTLKVLYGYADIQYQGY